MAGVLSGNVCVYGAGGPVGAMVARALQDDYTLRLTDLHDVDDILAQNKPQSKGAPLPEKPVSPNEWQCVDVSDYEQVRAAAEGMDALINVSVLRHDVVPAFRVNLVGAYNVMKAAVECGIKRIIHTGPRHTRLGFEGDYWPDFDVPDEAPLHPGSDLYALTKHLGGQVVRVFAEEHDLEVLCFLFTGFRPGDPGPSADGSGVGPLTVAWEDTGDPFRLGLQVDKLSCNYEVFDITVDLPHRKFGTGKAQRLLGWQPQYTFERHYRRKTD
ncbi:MAG: NAD-dependent epimerase/dehydratase family protein [Candidatus Latescibacteria bacterium]|nr:NAD-dependent epimerase/dehydratase family protein [Candidatus Latescibacterota bacterium]